MALWTTIVASVNPLIHPLPLCEGNGLITARKITKTDTTKNIRRMTAAVGVHFMIAVRLLVSVDVKIPHIHFSFTYFPSSSR